MSAGLRRKAVCGSGCAETAKALGLTIPPAILAMVDSPRLTAASRIKEVSAKREHSVSFMSGAFVVPASPEQWDRAVSDRRHQG
jgi:hypothetical protein